MDRGSGWAPGPRAWVLAVAASLLVPSVGAQPPVLARDWRYLDRLLGRPYTAGTPFRSTGENLWAIHPTGWGFRSDVNYIHLDWFEPFTLELAWRGLAVGPDLGFAHASHLTTKAVSPSGIALEEHKFIAPEDVLVVVIRATNLEPTPGVLDLTVTSKMMAPLGDAMAASLVHRAIPLELYLEMTGGTAAPGKLARAIPLAPGDSIEVRVAMSFARDAATARSRVAAVLAAADPVARQEQTFGQWFLDNVPQLDVPDPWWETAWAFRWEVTRRNLSEPRTGRLKHPTFMEGRWMDGWFPKVITYGAPHQLKEARWYRNPRYARGHALTFVDTINPSGAFASSYVNGASAEYTEWITAAIDDVYQVSGDTDLLVQAVAAMRRNVDYIRSRDRDRDHLPVVIDHYQTGMEWQPSFFYFNNYYTDTSTPLERVEYASMLYANAKAVARASATLCDASAEADAEAIAAQVRAAVESKMWDQTTRFYYSLRETDDAKALAREIAGFYPLALDLATAQHESMLARLFDPAEFWTAYPPASTARSCPAYSQSGWPIGPGGSKAMWNGPTWPHATSVVVDAVGRSLRRSGETWATRAQLWQLLESYTQAQFCCAPGRQVSDPLVGEYYSGDGGDWRTTERDYFHSTYADIVITKVIGLEPDPSGDVILDPLLPPGTWDRFLLERVNYRGHDLTIVWDEPGGADAYGDGRAGLDLYIDGQRAASRPGLGRLSAALPPDRIYLHKDRPDASAVRIVHAGTPPPWSLFRAASPRFEAPVVVPGSPFAATAVTLAAAPAASEYYRAGACGHGR